MVTPLIWDASIREIQSVTRLVGRRANVLGLRPAALPPPRGPPIAWTTSGRSVPASAATST